MVFRIRDGCELIHARTAGRASRPAVGQIGDVVQGIGDLCKLILVVIEILGWIAVGIGCR